VNNLKHNFVECVPEALDDSVLYVSVKYGTAVHRCCCGCGREVVTPLTPTDWKLTFDGETVSLYPSIGNWNFACRSHYWIRNNEVEWAEDWPDWKVEAMVAKDHRAKACFYNKQVNEASSDESASKPEKRKSFWSRLWRTAWKEESD
jgi:Family of unknown function (DUF6527)